MIRDLPPLLGRRLSFGVVPDWHCAWPLHAHPEYCRLISENSAELLLHGYFHRRQCGRVVTTLLTDGSDEMNELDPAETRRTLERGQRVFTDMFGEPARGFLAPAWQRGHVRTGDVEHVLGFFSLESSAGRNVPLATWSWDCGRWDWLGHVGHGIGSLLHSLNDRVPVLAIHPKDLERGYWRSILRLARNLLEAGYEPATLSRLLKTT